MPLQLPNTTYDRRARAGRLIHRAQVVLTESLDRELAQSDISAAQYVILSTLAAGSADTAAQICKEISYSPGAMTRMLDRLENKGMIRRVPYVDNRRSVRLELTEEGKAKFPALRLAATTVIDRYFGALDAPELQQLGSLLEKMLAGR